MLLIYAVHKRDPVFILAYLPNAFVYLRNLQLIKKDEEGATDLVRGAGRGAADAEG